MGYCLALWNAQYSLLKCHLLKPNARCVLLLDPGFPSSWSIFFSPSGIPASILCVARGCNCLWLGDSNGNLHRVSIIYKLSTDTASIDPPTDSIITADTSALSSGMGNLAATIQKEEEGQASKLNPDPILIVTEASVVAVFGFSISHIFVSQPLAQDQSSKQMGILSSCEVLIVIGWAVWSHFMGKLNEANFNWSRGSILQVCCWS